MGSILRLADDSFHFIREIQPLHSRKHSDTIALCLRDWAKHCDGATKPNNGTAAMSPAETEKLTLHSALAMNMS